jgi:hypothetical protein
MRVSIFLQVEEMMMVMKIFKGGWVKFWEKVLGD